MDVTRSIGEFWNEDSVSSATLDWVLRGLSEDRASEDLASQTLFEEGAGPVMASIRAGAPGVLCGGPAALLCFQQLDPTLAVVELRSEGSSVQPGDRVLAVRGTVRAVLGAERTALNMLSHLSGIATRARTLQHLAGPSVQVLDTRKTLPGLRLFQKFAVRCGGASNHRGHLAEFPMVKENHRDLFRARPLAPGTDVRGELVELVRRFRTAYPGLPLEVEVEDRSSLLCCLELGVDFVLVDNQSPAELSSWLAEATRRWGPEVGARVEASGGITAATLPQYAATGVGRISLGELTHTVRALDYSLHVEWPPLGDEVPPIE